MSKTIRFYAVFLALCFSVALPFVPSAEAQQTLGGITGALTDKSGGALLDATVTIVSDQNHIFSRTQRTTDAAKAPSNS